ncbi:hypothetical protein SAMN04488527_10738 [Aliiroseovarius crassostreae]|uniref:Uncharacterized protein n=1 Tax=Aliiroseovarius crassostreae TaxID=154981 RepID=A0A0P7I2E9_9RHOB|nr:hypothetical protein [Aliiroseovarius crassostreae]KPN63175.1 hypothetical protein AKJ29_10750 [Aliiroseovarius crassostreae]SFU58678.1 hypothetical protein SAMN04488527_10738 [Aliiroseovarius crassostreae]
MDIAKQILIELLPFWEQLFSLAGVVAWPLAAYFVARLFSDEFKSLLPRLRKLGPTGAEFEAKEQKGVISPDSRVELSKVSLTELHDPNAQVVENSIIEALEAIPEENQVAVLVRGLTEARMLRAFERFYANIFGSQIEALQLLNSRNVSRSEAINLLDELKAERGILDGWNIDMYMAYLKDASFVTEEAGEYRITETGRNFLRFIVDNGLSTEKSL